MRIRFDRLNFLQTGAVVALLVFAVPVNAFAADRETVARINRLENEIQTLSRAVFKGEQPPAGSAVDSGIGGANAADIQNRLSQMERSIQILTGKIEEQGYALNRLKESFAQQGAGTTAPATGYGMTSVTTPEVSPPTRTNNTYSYSSRPTNAADVPDDNGFTMADPNAPAPANAPTAGRLGSIVTNVDQNGNATGNVPATPAAEYDAAFNLLRNQDYAGAQLAFDTFIKKNPDHALVSNAMYWLGETYYVRNDFVPATKIFAEAYQKYPKGPKAPDNLLKLGLSLAGQGKTKDACVALAQLKKQYPAGSAPVLTRGDQEIERLKCSAQ